MGIMSQLQLGHPSFGYNQAFRQRPFANGAGGGPQFVLPSTPQISNDPPPTPVAPPSSGGVTGDILNSVGLGGAPAAPAAGTPASPAASPYGSGIMGSIMKAFNGGAGGGMDPSKLMSMLSSLGIM